jgi:hypothetical protein
VVLPVPASASTTSTVFPLAAIARTAATCSSFNRVGSLANA